MKRLFILAGFCFCLGFQSLVGAEENQEYDYTTKGTRIFKSPDGSFMAKILVEEANLGGGETKIAELTFPVGYEGSGHLHGAVEIFYVLEGRFGHEVNGVNAILEPGEIGIVRIGDSVVHRVHSEIPAKVLTIWVPADGSPMFQGMPEEKIPPKN